MMRSTDIHPLQAPSAPPQAPLEARPQEQELPPRPEALDSPMPEKPANAPSVEDGWACGVCEQVNARRAMHCQQCNGSLPMIGIFKAARREIRLGEPIRLSWEVENAERVEIHPGPGRVAPTGILDVYPDEDTTYTLTAYNPVGQRQIHTKVILKKPRIHYFRATDPEVSLDYPTILHWEVENGAELSLNLGIGDVSGKSFTEARLAYPGRCVLTARNKAGEVQAYVDLTMSQPEIRAFAASSAMIKDGSPTVLSWEVANADRVEILPEVGDVSDQSQVLVSPDQDTTYILYAHNHAGTVMEQVSLQMPPPKIVRFVGSSELSTEGKSIILSWEIENAYRVYLDQGIGEVGKKGSVKVKPKAAYTTYTLTAEGFAGVAHQQFQLTQFPIPLTKQALLPIAAINVPMEISDKQLQDSLPNLEQIEKELRQKTRERQRSLRIERARNMHLTEDMLALEKSSAKKEFLAIIKKLINKFRKS